jgi:hypothetical protein
MIWASVRAPDALFAASAYTRNGDFLFRRHLYHRRSKLTLERFGLISHHAQSFPDIIRDLVARDGHNGRVANRVVLEHGNVGRAAAYIDQRHTDFLLVLMQDGKRGTKWFEDDVGDFVSRLFRHSGRCSWRRRQGL